MTVAYKDIPEELKDVYLTPTQIEICRYLAKGDDCKEIAQKMRYSDSRVVRNKIYNVQLKLKAKVPCHHYNFLLWIQKMGLID